MHIPRRRWQDLSDRQRFLVLTLGSIQVSLAATAWADLATRPAESVNGSKRFWALIIAINWVGPICYFRWGHQRGLAGTGPPRSASQASR